MCISHFLSSVPLSLASERKRIEAFLASNGLRMSEFQYYAVITASEDSEEILAGGGLDGNVIKGVAVSESARSEGLANKLISHLLETARAEGLESVMLFTKTENLSLFSSLGFQLLAYSQKAVLMENGFSRLRKYCGYLNSLRKEGRNGAIVMNANPFTKGHRHLIEQASAQVDQLYVIAVKEELSRFPYCERLAMMKAGTFDLPNVTVCEGSDYTISSMTFPTYFLKRLEDASDVQMRLDLDLFARHIAPALGVSVRFAGSEPSDPLTARYNEIMTEALDGNGMEFIEIPRLCEGDTVISATALRASLDGESAERAFKFAYPTSLPYIAADLAAEALLRELDTTPKPGLVDRHDSGAHTDMDYDCMRRSISALRPYFAELALCGVRDLDPVRIKETGIRAEEAMLKASGGVNTHKGALFCIGLSVAVISNLLSCGGVYEEGLFRRKLSALSYGIPSAKDTHGACAVEKYRVSGALESARKAYPELFSDWLPYYRSLRGDVYREHKTLLKIMTTLDDTNILHRNGYDALAECRQDAAALLAAFSGEGLSSLNDKFISSRTSPGGSADMLSLTVFISNFY